MAVVIDIGLPGSAVLPRLNPYILSPWSDPYSATAYREESAQVLISVNQALSLRRLLGKSDDEHRKLLLHMAQKMARR
jgi:hypothetical protein